MLVILFSLLHLMIPVNELLHGKYAYLVTIQSYSLSNNSRVAIATKKHVEVSTQLKTLRTEAKKDSVWD